ncbi:zinc-dependent peptidase [Hyphococcus luteus]|uniref:Zinc-dependent peptidase n=1 Tax=Hyphococcus luteus TaxID=2058213 RepID=A0A2S7K993_9PROT|nr:M90 family metallopeptidase [Marinicaulis flavus]PQA89070.1 hypothetical protein CW354_03730 [Marinicaulis flavus]
MNLLLIILVAGAGLLLGGYWALKRRRTEALMAAPLPAEHRRILRAKVPIYSALPHDIHKRLDGLINRFLAEKKFYGQGGLELTEEMRVVIAAQACLLIVNKENRWFKTLDTIHVYPGAFTSNTARIEGHVHTEHRPVRAGESWARGPVVLSWDQAAYGAFAAHDGHNVVFHEFAHQLDNETGVTDGSPLLDKDQSASRWAQVFRAAYKRLREDAAAGRANALDPYGATNPAEFFAVASEVFFEQPKKLQDAEPELYEEMAHYYRLDPADWV